MLQRGGRKTKSGEKKPPCETELSTLIRRALAERGARTVKQSGSCVGLSGELIRRVITEGHIPKDRTLTRIAQSLGLEPSVLILAAHRARMPAELLSEVLPPSPPAAGNWSGRRKWPLSQEQCDYLVRVMQVEEIQLIRKIRQLSPEERQQLAGYINYMFATCRVPASLLQPEQSAVTEGGDRG